MMLSDKKIKHIHCLGIGGIGVSALAEILLKKGYRITGSDIAENKNTGRLEKLGAEIVYDHEQSIVIKADLAIYSSAIAAHNPEFVAAQKARVPLISRGKLLAELMSEYHSTAIAGAHGKTTTTAMLVHAFTKANKDPTFMVGGVLKDIQSPAGVGKSHYFIAEADESDASFLFMHPNNIIITNIDADHLETYGGDFNRLKQTYLQFLQQMPEDGVAVLCVDDPVIRELMPRISAPVVTYGFSSDASYRVCEYAQEGLHAQFRIDVPCSGSSALITLNAPGRHNALNAAAIFALCDKHRVDHQTIMASFADYPGVDRRFHLHGEMALTEGCAVIIEDYGHHPSEVRATLTTARSVWPDRRIVLVFQPHRYSRTRDLMTEFTNVLSEADLLVLLEVYPAGEVPIPGVDSKVLLKTIETRATNAPVYVASLTALPGVLPGVLRPNDVVIFQGAGSVGGVAATLVKDK